jgi:anti-sigma factor RsiW
MCEYSGKLVAWLDREFGNDEMSEVERHIGACNECQSRIETYAQVSASFDGYCDAVLLAKPRQKGLPRWVPAVTTAAAVAIAATLVFVLLRPRVEPPAIPSSLQVHAPTPAIVVEKTPAPVPGKVAHRQRHAAQEPRQVAGWQPTERAIQISIPAESIFPPGAVPEGVNFTADLSIAADGSAEQIRLRPRLIEVQRRQP